MTITKERIRELAKTKVSAAEGICLSMLLEAAIRLGMAEMREVAAKEAESIGTPVNTVYAAYIRAIRIEGEAE